MRIANFINVNAVRSCYERGNGTNTESRKSSCSKYKAYACYVFIFLNIFFKLKLVLNNIPLRKKKKN